MDDEEDVDEEDTYDEFVDPWGIINMPLKVTLYKDKDTLVGCVDP